MGDNIWSTLFYIFVMVAVLLAAYYTTKYLSGRARRIIKSRHIIVLDRMAIARDKMLMVVKVGGKSLLIGVTNQSIQSLGEVEVGEATETQDEQSAPSNTLSKFARIFSSVRNAPDELAKARREAKMNMRGQSEAENAEKDDYLERMTRAMESRKNAKSRDNEAKDE